MEDNFTPDTFSLQVDNGNIPYLNEAARWAKFLAIVGFVICAFLLLIAFFFTSFFSSSISDLNEVDGGENLGGIIVTIYIVVIVALYFFPLFYLFSFGSKMQTALRNNDQINLNAAFRNLKSCLKFMGILTIIVLCFYAITIIFTMLGTAFIH